MIGRVGISFYSLRTALLCMSLAFTALTACGDDNPETNLCKGVTCDSGGVCEKATGQCINPTDCAGNDDLCLDGFTCNASTCEAEIACDGGACERGVCANGACINPAACTTNANCLGDFYCGDDNTCAADPCSTTTCDAGVCQIGTGECVNADICTRATEATDCVAGSKCDGGQCVTEAAFCAGLDCQRGVCSFADLACINSDNCGGDDSNCLAGNYCADDNTCKANVCDALNQTCARGECDPSSGQCVNPDTCTNANGCIDAFVCVGAACVATDDACGAGGCAGNQVCNYDDAASTATCGESPAGCSSALDCSTDRICDGGVCAAPAACVNDAFEPNNVAGEETEYATANAGLPVELALCGTDVDRITFVTTDDADLTGTLVAEVNIFPSDVGLGVLALDLLNESGTSVGTARTELNGAPTAAARVEFAVTAINGGRYTLVVSDGGDVSTAGVRYTARMDVVDAAVVAACAAPTALVAGTPVAGTTANGSSALTSSCGDADGTNPEAVYSFTIDRAVFATFVASPLTATADLALNIRSVCEQGDSELDCADALGANRNETLTRQLSAGTYIVVVEAATATTGGQFALSVSVEDIICSAADNTCLDPDTANVCNSNGTGFDSEACDDGCEAGAGVCSRPAGDVCSNAFPVDLNTPFNATINRSEFLNDYDPGAASCVPNNSNSQDTDGPDTVWAVTVPDGHVLLAEVSAVDFDDATLYLVEDCTDVANTCLVGVNAVSSSSTTAESLFWNNDTGAEKTVFLIADVEDETSLGNPRVSVSVQPFVCAPGTSRCVLNRESQSCNAAGTGYDNTTQCDDGCDVLTGACTTTNDSCDTATVLDVLRDGLPGTLSTEVDIGNYTNAHGNCGSSSSNRLDAIYVIPNLQVGDFVSVDVNATFDSIISIHSGCTAGAFGSCIEEEDTAFGGQNTETIEFTVPVGGSYYVMVQPWSSSTSAGTFTVQATITPAECVPGDPAAIACSADLSSVEYCGANGQFTQYTCGGGCVAGVNPSCAVETGDSCYDAETLTAGNTLSGSKSGTYNGSNFVELPSGAQGSCNVSSATTGNDHVYAFDLQPGDVLNIDTLPGTSSAALYLFEGACGIPSACEDFQTGVTAGNNFEYLATAPVRVYFVVDYRFTSSTTTWNFSWDVTSTSYVCLPGAVSCLDPTTVARCTADGLAQNFVPCPGAGACSAGSCASVPATADLCVGAVDIGAGGSFSVDPALFTSDVNILSGNSCFSATYGAEGEEALYQVTLQPYQILEVVGRSTGDFSHYQVVWAFTDCADAVNSCLNGATSSGDAKFTYQAGGVVETVFVALDNEALGGDVRYYDVDVRDPDCLPTDPLVCNVAGTGINTCVVGEIVEYTCGGGCVAGACNVPRGDTCFDSKVLTGLTGTVAGDWAQNTNAVNITSTQTGGCSFNSFDLPDGADDIYAVTLAAGETLKAQLVTSTSAAHMYIVGDCNDANNTCLVSDPLSQSASTINYRSTLGETVFVVVDRDDTSTTGTYTLNYDITNTQVCAPNTTRCIDANSVELCGPTGLATSYTCPSGCAGVACSTGVQADSCASAVDVGLGAAILGTYDDFVDDLDFGNACTGEIEDGPDAFYSVTLLPNQIVRARLLSLNNEPPLLYFLNSCDADAASCIQGTHEDASGQDDNILFLEYQSLLGETVVIGVDNEFSTANDPFFLTVEVLTPDCDPATFVQACNVAGTGFEYCDATGFTREYLCDTTCNATSNRCDAPIGDVCLDPFEANPPVLGTALTITGTLADFTNNYDLGTGNVCTLSRTIGAEPVYVVDLTVGQVLTATVVSDETTPEDLALYVTDDCSNVRTQCLGGADNEGGTAVPESLTFTATVDGPIYLMVDSFYSNASGDFTLNVTVN